MTALYNHDVAEAIIGTLFWGAKFPSDVDKELRAQFGDTDPQHPIESWSVTFKELRAQDRVRLTSTGRVRKVRFWETRTPKVLADAAH